MVTVTVDNDGPWNTWIPQSPFHHLIVHITDRSCDPARPLSKTREERVSVKRQSHITSRIRTHSEDQGTSETRMRRDLLACRSGAKTPIIIRLRADHPIDIVILQLLAPVQPKSHYWGDGSRSNAKSPRDGLSLFFNFQIPTHCEALRYFGLGQVA